MSYDPAKEPTPEQLEMIRQTLRELAGDEEHPAWPAYSTEELRASLIARGIDADGTVRRGMELIARYRAPEGSEGEDR